MSANKILVPIGFSEQSILALGQAFNLAKIKNSDVVLLSVVKEQSMMQSLFVDDLTDQLKLKVKQKLNELAKQYGDKFGVSVDTMVSKGKIYEQINEVAELISADLIVMGTNGSQGNKSKLIGSNAEKVVRLSKCPVITIKGKDNRIGCENIILPLDLERQTKEKVTYALEYARYWNATIRVVSVVLRDNQEVREKLKKNINQVHDFIVKAGVKCSAELIEGGKKITLGNFVFQYEKKFDADLFIIYLAVSLILLERDNSSCFVIIIIKSASNFFSYWNTKLPSVISF